MNTTNTADNHREPEAQGPNPRILRGAHMCQLNRASGSGALWD